jgi:hypothetical protein
MSAPSREVAEQLFQVDWTSNGGGQWDGEALRAMAAAADASSRAMRNVCFNFTYGRAKRALLDYSELLGGYACRRIAVVRE